MKNNEKSDKKVEELYKWYKDVKTYVTIWIKVSEWFIIILITLIVMVIGIKLYDGVIFFWPQISVDAKFGLIITLAIFIIGILIGRGSKISRD